MSYTSIWGGHINEQIDCKICYAFGIMSQIEAQFYIKFYRTYFLPEQELLIVRMGLLVVQKVEIMINLVSFLLQEIIHI